MRRLFRIFIVIAAFLPSILQAQVDGPVPPTPPSGEAGLPENCTWPGVVINSTSNKKIRIWWDTDDAPYQWKDADLNPGENSKKYTCDADYFTYRFQNWYYGVREILAGHPSPYIYHMTWECLDYRVNTVKCYFRGYNFNPGTDD